MKKRMLCILAFLLVAVWAWYTFGSPNKEHYVSYAYPWWQGRGWPWNWWRRWYNRGWWDRIIKPRCPAGCVYTGYTSNNPSGYGCPAGGLNYGHWSCQYDFQCQGCAYPVDGPGGQGYY
jgi:hypothetical protein